MISALLVTGRLREAGHYQEGGNFVVISRY